MRNGFFSIAGLLVAWQALFQFAGTHALSPPLDTMLFLVHLLGTATFWGHLLETGRAFVAALALSVVLGLGIGLPFGLNTRAERPEIDAVAPRKPDGMNLMAPEPDTAPAPFIVAPPSNVT